MRVSTGFSDEAGGRRDEELMTHREVKEGSFCFASTTNSPLAGQESSLSQRLSVSLYTGMLWKRTVRSRSPPRRVCLRFAARGPGGRKNRRSTAKKSQAPPQVYVANAKAAHLSPR